jgi:hypothetical protein
VCDVVSTVLRAVSADFFFNCWCLEIPSDNRIWYRGPSTIMRRAFDWKRSRISTLEVKAVPQSYIWSIILKLIFKTSNVRECAGFMNIIVA